MKQCAASAVVSAGHHQEDPRSGCELQRLQQRAGEHTAAANGRRAWQQRTGAEGTQQQMAAGHGSSQA